MPKVPTYDGRGDQIQIVERLCPHTIHRLLSSLSTSRRLIAQGAEQKRFSSGVRQTLVVTQRTRYARSSVKTAAGNGDIASVVSMRIADTEGLRMSAPNQLLTLSIILITMGVLVWYFV